MNLSPVPQEGDSQEWVLVELEGGSGSACSKPEEEERSTSPLALPRTWSDPLPQRASTLSGSGELHTALCHTGPPFTHLPGLPGLTGLSGITGLRRLPTIQPASMAHINRSQLEQVSAQNVLGLCVKTTNFLICFLKTCIFFLKFLKLAPYVIIICS